jgi:hypothetical protein
MYGDELCAYENLEVLGINHLALTADPDFICTWFSNQEFSADELLSANVIDTAGEAAYCMHCAECTGHPTDEDLDPVARWRRLLDEHPEASRVGT